MRSVCLIQCCYVGFRFLRYKAFPWVTLAIAPIKLLTASGMNREFIKARCLITLGKINFAAVYEFINDLLW